jgi:nitrate reductase alpha subunit
MTGGHTRWSIHSSWRDHKLMLDLQRGEPAVFMSKSDAAARGVADGDRVRINNDVGGFELVAKVAASVRPGQVVVYHAWEPFQFAGHKSHQSLTPSPFNPIQMAGGYFHLQQFMTVGQPGMNDRGTRVEVSKLGAGSSSDPVVRPAAS